MLVVFANNQSIIDYNAVVTTIYTDPVPIGDNNQATGTTSVHRLFNYFTGYGLKWNMEVSNDGVNFVTQGPATGALESAATSLQTPTKVSGVYARLAISFKADTSVIGGALFDVHVNFDRT